MNENRKGFIRCGAIGPIKRRSDIRKQSHLDDTATTKQCKATFDVDSYRSAICCGCAFIVPVILQNNTAPRHPTLGRLNIAKVGPHLNVFSTFELSAAEPPPPLPSRSSPPPLARRRASIQLLYDLVIVGQLYLYDESFCLEPRPSCEFCTLPTSDRLLVCRANHSFYSLSSSDC